MKGYLVNEEIEVKIKKREINLIILTIPIISLIVGGWLIFKYYSSLGPLITIKFKNSGGLEPKRSFVKFRDVKVGKVESVEILKEGGVLVKVRMSKDVKPFLNNTTKFWIVKPEIGIDKIRGLDALLSGPYIQMYAKAKEFTKDYFIGLDSPPLDKAIVNGKVYTLVADKSYSIKERMPVYYKDIKVGMVRKVELKNNKVYIYIVIWKQYDKYVNNSTKFWNLKKADISLKGNNLEVSMPSFKALIFGGIEFETPEKTSKTKTYFYLFSSKNEAFENKLTNNLDYVTATMNFNYDNSYLQKDTPIEFKGFRVGYLKSVKSFYNEKNNSITTKVIAKIEKFADFKQLIQNGLVAYIKLTPIINSATIVLDFNKTHKFRVINNKILIPTIYKKEISLSDKINKFLDKLNSLPLNKTLNNVNSFLNTTKPAISKALYSVTNLTKTINNEIKTTSKNLNHLIVDIDSLTKELSKTSKTYNKNSIFYQKVSKTLYDLDKTLLNLNKVINKIDKKPNSIILGD